MNKLIKQTWKLDVVTCACNLVLHLTEAGSGFREQQLQTPKQFSLAINYLLV